MTSELRNYDRPLRTVASVTVIALLFTLALSARWLSTVNPGEIDPTLRNRPAGEEVTRTLADGTQFTQVAWMGTDTLGRDLFSRTLYGTRVSLFVGLAVTVLACAIGVTLGLVAGFIRWLDAGIMRAMDGLMAIPGILLAIGIVAAWRGSLSAVVVAIAVPEVPRVVRLVRSVALKARHEPYVEAAVASGTRIVAILMRHVLPNAVGPLVVQATFVCASAILIEASLSFLGIGVPPDQPTWGNIMADGRQWFRLRPEAILFPGIFIAVTVLSVNMLGESLRNAIESRDSRAR